MWARSRDNSRLGSTPGRLLKLSPDILSERMIEAERQVTQLGRLVERLLLHGNVLELTVVDVVRAN